MRYQKNPLAIIYVILGLIIFFAAAGAFLLRLIFAVFGLWLFAYGLQLMKGRPTILFWKGLDFRNRNE